MIFKSDEMIFKSDDINIDYVVYSNQSEYRRARLILNLKRTVLPFHLDTSDSPFHVTVWSIWEPEISSLSLKPRPAIISEKECFSLVESAIST